MRNISDVGVCSFDHLELSGGYCKKAGTVIVLCASSSTVSVTSLTLRLLCSRLLVVVRALRSLEPYTCSDNNPPNCTKKGETGADMSYVE